MDAGFDLLQSYLADFLDRTANDKTYIETDHKGSGIRNATITAEGNRNFRELFDVFIQHVDKVGLNPASGGHLAYIPGGGVLPSAFGDFIADFTNRYAGVFFANPGAVHMENMLIEWMAEVLGYPKSAYGNLASGGSIANLVAIVCARDGQGVRSIDIPNSVIYLSNQAHHSVDKALRIAGLKECILRHVPIDDRFRMKGDELERMVQADSANGLNPFLVVSSLGTTDTGSIDPIEEIGKIAERHNLWHHIDAAYGGFFVLLDEFQHLKKGISLSDSITIDPHKGLFLPYGTGAVLVKDPDILAKSHAYTAAYMQDTLHAKEEYSPAEFSPELTKHYRGLRMWLPLMYYGLNPFLACLEEKLALTRYFRRQIQQLGFVIGPEPELSVCIYRYVPKKGDANEFNLNLIQKVKEQGSIFLSSTSIDGVVWLRLAALSFRTHKSHVDRALEQLKRLIN